MLKSKLKQDNVAGNLNMGNSVHYSESWGLFSNFCKTLQRMMSYEFSNRSQSSHFWDTSRLMFQAAALNVYVENYATSNSNYICVTNNITGRGNRN